MASSAFSSRPGSGAATPSAVAGPSSKPALDVNRPLAKVYFKPLEPFLPPPPYDHLDLSIPKLLDVPAQVYHSRLANRHLVLNANDTDVAGGGASGSGSGAGGGETKATTAQKALRGKKRSRGDEAYRREVRRALDEQRAERDRKGLVGERKRNKELAKLGKEGAVKKGMKVEYDTIVPLHHLHTVYLAQLLSLPPLPPDLLAYCHSPEGESPSALLPEAVRSASESLRRSLPKSSDSLLSHLSKASFLGAELRVCSSRNASLVGIAGLCISETASTFALLPRAPSPGDENSMSTVRIIPKAGTQFTLSYPAFAPPDPQLDADGREEPVDMGRFERVCPRVSVDFLGDNFGYRSGDRAGRKFRPAQGGGGGSGWGETWVQGEWSTVLGQLEAEQAKTGAGSRATANSSVKKQRKKGKSRRKDPPSFGRILE